MEKIRNLVRTPISFEFREEYTKDERIKEAKRIRSRYPDRVPIIVETGPNIQQIDKKKYLCPADLTVGNFAFVLRKRMKLPAEKAMIIFTEAGNIPNNSWLVSEFYEKNSNEDKFLYVIIDGMNTFG